MRALALTMLGVLLLSGCTILQEPKVKEVAGPTDGYTPTSTYLKVHVKRADGSLAMLDFDRRDWYASKIVELLDHRQMEFVSAQAKPRDILNEYLVESVADPGEVAKLRFDDMDATPEQRAQMDSEYESLLKRYLEDAPAPPIAPTALLPQDPLP